MSNKLHRYFKQLKICDMCTLNYSVNGSSPLVEIQYMIVPSLTPGPSLLLLMGEGLGQLVIWPMSYATKFHPAF